jgi:hypothetical protein
MGRGQRYFGSYIAKCPTVQSSRTKMFRNKIFVMGNLSVEKSIGVYYNCLVKNN